MTPEQVQQLREKLIQACDNHLAQGGKIVANYFCRGEKQENCCPVYALAGIQGGVNEALSTAVGFPVSHDETWSFLHSFDDAPAGLAWLRTQGKLVQEMVDLGTELRAKYITPGEQL